MMIGMSLQHLRRKASRHGNNNNKSKMKQLKIRHSSIPSHCDGPSTPSLASCLVVYLLLPVIASQTNVVSYVVDPEAMNSWNPSASPNNNARINPAEVNVSSFIETNVSTQDSSPPVTSTSTTTILQTSVDQMRRRPNKRTTSMRLESADEEKEEGNNKLKKKRMTGKVSQSTDSSSSNFRAQDVITPPYSLSSTKQTKSATTAPNDPKVTQSQHLGSQPLQQKQTSSCPDWGPSQTRDSKLDIRKRKAEGVVHSSFQDGMLNQEAGFYEVSVDDSFNDEAKSGFIACSCYEFEEGLFIECPNTDLNSIKYSLSNLSKIQSSSSSHPVIKSYTVYNLESTITSFPSHLFVNSTSIEKLRVSDTQIRGIEEESLLGLETSLKALSISSSRLRFVPTKSLSKLKVLESLDLDSNEIDKIDSYSFYGLPLTSLSLQGNKITSLHEYSFGGLENTLSELTLANNNLDSFPLSAVRRLKNLRVLKMNGNQMTSLPKEDGFTRFTLLHTLDLRGNHLTDLDDLRSPFELMPKLVSLSLSSNKLNSIGNKLFLPLTDLESLDLSKNSLVHLHGAVFASQRKIKSIDLSYNQLQYLEVGTFHNLPNLRELFLTRNNLTKLMNGTFYNTPQVGSLYLEHNSLRELDSGVFSSLTHLFQLHLSFNQLKVIPTTLFRSTQQLRSLSLDNNGIEIIKPGTFDNLKELRDLRLQKNVIQKISAGSFNSIPFLQELHLQNNMIDSIEEDSFKTLVNLEYLNLQGNQLETLTTLVFGSGNTTHPKYLTINFGENIPSFNRTCSPTTTPLEASSKQMIIFENMSLVGLAIIVSSLLFVLISITTIAGIIVKVKKNRRRRRVKSKEKDMKEEEDNKDLDHQLHHIHHHHHHDDLGIGLDPPHILPDIHSDLHLHHSHSQHFDTNAINTGNQSMTQTLGRCHHHQHPPHLDIQLTRHQETEGELPEPVLSINDDPYITYRHFPIPINDNGLYP